MDRLPRASFVRLLPLVVLVGCGASDGALEPRFVAVHNALSAAGLVQHGPIHEGSLVQGGESSLSVELEEGGCYVFVVLGSAQAGDVDLKVVGDGGAELASDGTHDRQAALRFCARTAGEYQLVVKMASGHGRYSLASWSGGEQNGPERSSTVGSADAAGTCESPIAIAMGRPVSGTTLGGASAMHGTCAPNTAPEKVYAFEIARRSRVNAVLQSTFDGSLYILSGCGSSRRELACNDDNPDADTTRSEVDMTLEPGVYFLVVDGYQVETGDFQLIISVDSLEELGAVCANAQPLTSGQPASGTTSDSADYFHASCAEEAKSPDRVFRLDIAQPSRVRVRQETNHDGALYVRKDSCEQASAEVVCSDDFLDERHALATFAAAPGTYYVIADGYGNGSSGTFNLTAEVIPASGSSTPSDTCAQAANLRPGSEVNIDTIGASDDLAGSCGGAGAPDVVYQLDVATRSRFRAKISRSELDGRLYIRRACDAADSEVVCGSFAQGNGEVDTVLDRGRYFVVFDGADDKAFGAASVNLSLDDMAKVERTCRSAPVLRDGQTLTGSTSGRSDEFQASCADGAKSGDKVYRVVVRRRSTVTVTVESQYDAALYLFEECGIRTSELACNDDHEDNRHARVSSTLDPGTYYVVVDGYRTGNEGSYEIRADFD